MSELYIHVGVQLAFCVTRYLIFPVKIQLSVCKYVLSKQHCFVDIYEMKILELMNFGKQTVNVSHFHTVTTVVLNEFYSPNMV